MPQFESMISQEHSYAYGNSLGTNDKAILSKFQRIHNRDLSVSNGIKNNKAK